MRYRALGTTGLSVSEIGVGTALAGIEGTDDAETREALQVAVDSGCTFFDTALYYAAGRSEQLLGELRRANPRRGLVVGTKIPPYENRFRGDVLDEVFPPAHIRASVERSLENLGVSRLDLVQFHVWQDAWGADETWQGEVARLRDEGLAGAVGLSLNRWEPWNGLETLQTGLVDTVEVVYNIFDQAPEDELFPLCAELGVGVIARVPFDEGTLTGTLSAESTFLPGDWRSVYFTPGNLSGGVARAEGVRALLPDGVTMPELALRFVLSNPAVSTVIPGMRKADQVRANVASSDAGPLPPELVTALRPHRWDRQLV